MRRNSKRPSFVSVAVYAFLFAICAKGIFLYGSQHPSKEQLLSLRGTVVNLRLGGDGRSTRLEVESESRTFRCSSYYGVVWPGMERMQQGDLVDLRLERSKVNSNELIEGKRYYIWELVHQSRVVIDYDDVHELVRGKEASLDRWINLWLGASLIVLLVAYSRRRSRQAMRVSGGSGSFRVG